MMTSIGTPSDVLAEGDNLYIADSLKGIVRRVSKGKIEILVGHPNEDFLKKPKKMAFQKDILYILCENEIKTFLMKQGVCGSIPFESNSIVSINADADKDLYILEEILEKVNA